MAYVRNIFQIKKLFFVVKTHIYLCVRAFVHFNVGTVVDTINNYFLDGMPCDHVTETELKNGSLINRHTDCLHLPYWNDAEISPELMCTLNRKWLDGFCESLDVGLKHTGKESIVTGSKECVDIYYGQD